MACDTHTHTQIHTCKYIREKERERERRGGEEMVHRWWWFPYFLDHA